MKFILAADESSHCDRRERHFLVSLYGEEAQKEDPQVFNTLGRCCASPIQIAGGVTDHEICLAVP